jgi:hypothetical protein
VRPVNKSRLIYEPRSDAKSESELSALAAVYAFVLKCHEQKEFANRSAPSHERKEVFYEPLTK